MSGSKFFRRLVRYALCLTAALLAFAACAYTDYRLWPLDLHAPRYPALPAPQIQGNRVVLPFAPGVAAAKVATSTTSSKPSSILNIYAVVKPATAVTHRVSF